MMLRFFLLALLAGVAIAELPCNLYDVTTLRRNETSVPKYEVHSRTNAIGLATNFGELTGLSDPLEDSRLTCLFNKEEVCPGWELNGFNLSEWHWNDPFLGWTERDKPSQSETCKSSPSADPVYILAYFAEKGVPCH